MRLANCRVSGFAPWLAGATVLLTLAHCGGNTATTETGSSGQGGSGGHSGSLQGSSGSGGGSTLSGSSGSVGGTTGSPSGGGSGAGPTSGGTSGSTTPTSDGGSSGTTSDAGPSGEGGTGNFGDCMVADVNKPCSTYTAATGQKIILGQYGSQWDVNVGKGFENPLQSGDQLPQNAGTCQLFVASFGEDKTLSDKLLQTTMNGITVDFALYSAYRPVQWPDAPVPVITWGDGTCAQPEGYGPLLRYVASYGYFVIAANSRWVGSGQTPQPMLHALDYAKAANDDPMSPYYHHLDLSKVGAMGHSQGGAATAEASADSRVQYVIDFNAVDSTSSTVPIKKPYLAVSGDMDITGFTAMSMATDINAANLPAAYVFFHNPAGMGPLKGHLVLMLSPERVNEFTKDWWEMWFRNDATAKAEFVGSSCGLCTGMGSSSYAYGHNTLLK